MEGLEVHEMTQGPWKGLRLMFYGGTRVLRRDSGWCSMEGLRHKTFAQVACLGPPRTPTYATTSWQGGEKCDSSTVIFGSWKSIKTELFHAINSCEPWHNYIIAIFVFNFTVQWNTKIFINIWSWQTFLIFLRKNHQWSSLTWWFNNCIILMRLVHDLLSSSSTSLLYNFFTTLQLHWLQKCFK